MNFQIAALVALVAATANAAPIDSEHSISRRVFFEPRSFGLQQFFLSVLFGEQGRCPLHQRCENGQRYGFSYLSKCVCDIGFEGDCCDKVATCDVSPIDTKDVDLEEYTRATWFVQRQQETGYQKKDQLFCNTATYDLGATAVPGFDGQVIDVFNYGNKGGVNGNFTGGPLCGRVSDDAGKLSVAPCFLGNDQAGPYWILDIGVQENGEYEWAVVIGGQPDEFGSDGLCTTSTEDINNSGLWFFTRNPIATPEQLHAMEIAIAKQGVSGTKMIDVVQSGCNYDDSDIKPRRPAGVLGAAPYGADFQAGCDTAPDALSFLNSPQNPNAVEQTCVDVNGLQRCWFTYTPVKARNAERRVQVVVHLHGAGGCASLPAAGWGTIAEREGFVMVWPQGTSFVPNRPGPPIPQTSWNDGSGLFPAQENQIDDMMFLSQLIETIARLPTIDASKIYFSGHSNGAVMSQRFALQQTTSQKVAGVLAFSGAGLPNDQLTQDFLKVGAEYEPTPIVLIAGTLDDVVSFGERRGPLAGAIPSTEGWASINGCAQQENEQVNGYNKYSFSGCTGNANVLLLEVPTAGHHPFVQGEGVFQIQDSSDIAFCPFKFIPGADPNTPDCKLVTVDAPQVAWDLLTKGETLYVAPPQGPTNGPPAGGPSVGGPPVGGPPTNECADVLDSTPSPIKCAQAIDQVQCSGSLAGFVIKDVCQKSCGECGAPPAGPPLTICPNGRPEGTPGADCEEKDAAAKSERTSTGGELPPCFLIDQGILPAGTECAK